MKFAGCPEAEQAEFVNVFASTGEIVALFPCVVVVQSVMNCRGVPSSAFEFVSLVAKINHWPVEGGFCAKAESETRRSADRSSEIFMTVSHNWM